MLVHIFREVDLLTLADLAKNALSFDAMFMHNRSVVAFSFECNYSLLHTNLILKETTHTNVHANVNSCTFIFIHVLPHTL